MMQFISDRRDAVLQSTELWSDTDTDSKRSD